MVFYYGSVLRFLMVLVAIGIPIGQGFTNSPWHRTSSRKQKQSIVCNEAESPLDRRREDDRRPNGPHQQDDDYCHRHRHGHRQSRWDFLTLLETTTVLTAMAMVNPLTTIVNAFDGGVGGLGKTKPITGVEFYGESMPVQNAQGMISAELVNAQRRMTTINTKEGGSTDGGPIQPILVTFQTPWPLLTTTSGLEARDLRTSESAFVQVLPLVEQWQNPKVFQQLLMDSVLAARGKFGAYGTPTDIKVKRISNDGNGLFSVTFTSYTPAMRESERQIWVVPQPVHGNTLVLLVIGTTRSRFASQEPIFEQIVQSFQAVAAPESKFRAR